jgi:hypothetical protein
LVTATAALLCGTAFAQAPAPAAPPEDAGEPPTDEVVVRGRRMSDVQEELRKYVNQFVVQVTKPPSGRGFARWQGRVCVSVSNLQHDAAQ